MSLLDHLRNLCKVGGDQVTRTIGDLHHTKIGHWKGFPCWEYSFSGCSQSGKHLGNWRPRSVPIARGMTRIEDGDGHSLLIEKNSGSDADVGGVVNIKSVPA